MLTRLDFIQIHTPRYYLQQQLKVPAKMGYEFFKINEARYQYLPIPQDELNTNKNMSQNTAWK